VAAPRSPAARRSGGAVHLRVDEAIFYSGNPGQSYNEGIGLGTPNLAKIADLFSVVLPF
jgi:hypothetical protein